MLKRSEFKRGEFLVTSDGSIFIHDGYKNGDGYGCLIGMGSNGELRKQSDGKLYALPNRPYSIR